MSFNYAAEKFWVARSNLMLPHPLGEAQSIADAFAECHKILRDLPESSLHDDAIRWVGKLRALMCTDGLSDPAGEGLFLVRARQLTIDQQAELSTLVDELQYWFDSNS